MKSYFKYLPFKHILYRIWAFLIIVPLFSLPLFMPQYLEKDVVKMDIATMAGRWVYENSGCHYCHTRNINYSAWSLARMRTGAPNFPIVPKYKYPDTEFSHLSGNRRVGPDLISFSGRVNRHYIEAKLREPQKVWRYTIMPSYDHLFQTNALSNRELITWLYWKLPATENEQILLQQIKYSMQNRSMGELLIEYLQKGS
ncbi:MAG: cbb3-type cytochrome c oxidase subunit II [Leptospirales bacterium]